MTPDRRTATLTDLVAQEIDAARGRKRMSQRQLCRLMGKTDNWISLRLRGIQPIDMNDLRLFADALGVDVYDLLPSREAAREAGPRTTVRYKTPHTAIPAQATRSADNRPPGRPGAATGPSGAVTRTGYLDRGGKRGGAR